MLIFENFISRYENFKSRDSSSTRNSTRHWEMVCEGVCGRTDLPSPHPLGINYRRVEATAATGSISALVTLTGRRAGTSFSCPSSGGCYRFIVSRVSRWCFTADRQASDHCWTLMLCSLTLWRPLLPYGYSYKVSCARPGCHLYFWHPGTLTLTLSGRVPRCQKLQMTA